MGLEPRRRLDDDERPLFFGLCWLALLAATSILQFLVKREGERSFVLFTAFLTDGPDVGDY